LLGGLDMRFLFSGLLLLHGLIHLMGFASAFGYARIEGMPELSRAAGALWLIAALLFVATSWQFAEKVESWWLAALVAAVLSQGLIVDAWKEAKFGTVVNLIALVAIAPGLARALPDSPARQYASAVREGLASANLDVLLTDAQTTHLPAIVRKYLRRAGAIGRVSVSSTRAVFEGRIRNGIDSEWMPMAVEQYNFFATNVRAFRIESSLHGIPFEGLHLFDRSGATMRVRVASTVPVADAAGPEMDQSETVTLFNDMCLLAPSTLIDSRITWEPLDALSVRAAFTYHGITIHAVLRFDETGDLVDFESDDRYQTTDGRAYAKYPWRTPVRDYRAVDGRRIWTQGEAIWMMPSGPFTYGEFRLQSIEYNPPGPEPRH
jgi:hypothetical protein